LEQYCAAKRLKRNPDLIRHAHPDSPATLPVIALPVAMVGSSLGTSLTAAGWHAVVVAGVQGRGRMRCNSAAHV